MGCRIAFTGSVNPPIDEISIDLSSLLDGLELKEARILENTLTVTN